MEPKQSFLSVIIVRLFACHALVTLLTQNLFCKFYCHHEGVCPCYDSKYQYQRIVDNRPSIILAIEHLRPGFPSFQKLLSKTAPVIEKLLLLLLCSTGSRQRISLLIPLIVLPIYSTTTNKIKHQHNLPSTCFLIITLRWVVLKEVLSARSISS